MTSSLAFTLHRPSVPSPLNPASPTISAPPKRRRLITPRRTAHLSPGQRLLRRKASEAYNAQIITTSLAAAPVPPRRAGSRPQLQNSQSAHIPLISLIPEPIGSTFIDIEVDDIDGSEKSMAISKPFIPLPVAALLRILHLPVLSVIHMRLSALFNVCHSDRKEPNEEEHFLQAAADLEEGRIVIQANQGVHLPLILTMRRLFAAVGFLCLYALMQFEPLFKRAGRIYA